MIQIVYVVALIMSAVVHEFSHGLAAWYLGDDTAKRAGRLTLNPWPHLDLFGSIILPLVFVLSGTRFFLAWAKPVPYNPYNLRDRKFGDLKVALAGPGSNLILAVIFGLLVRFMAGAGIQPILLGASLASSAMMMAVIICIVNLSLMIFNLIPLPPLDGSKIILTFLNSRQRLAFYQLERYSIFLVLALALFGAFEFIGAIIGFLFQLIVGVGI